MQVLNLESTLLVDSLDISSELGVDHNDWMNSVVYKYQSEVEQTFGVLRVENVKLNDTGRHTKHALLTEDQATLYMTTKPLGFLVIL